jgi:hypothetical protein
VALGAPLGLESAAALVALAVALEHGGPLSI